MIEIDQSDYRVGSDTDLHTSGLGPCVGIVVGYKGRVSMLHAPMPDAGGAEAFLAELCDAIPQQDRSAVRPVLAGALTTFGRHDQLLTNTRNWVVAQFKKLGFGLPLVYWGDGGKLACHTMTTCIKTGTVQINHHELTCESPEPVAVAPLW